MNNELQITVCRSNDEATLKYYVSRLNVTWRKEHVFSIIIYAPVVVYYSATAKVHKVKKNYCKLIFIFVQKPENKCKQPPGCFLQEIIFGKI